jgi:hypothetical protein
MLSKLHKIKFRHFSNITVNVTTMREALILVLLIEGFYEVRVCRCNGFMRRDISTKFHENWYWRSSNIKIFPQQFVGFTNGRTYDMRRSNRRHILSCILVTRQVINVFRIR